MSLRTLALHITFLLSLVVANASTSVQKVHFSHYQTNSGLVSNRVYAIQQDKNGFLWVATDYGLERFDGRNFKLYNKDLYPNLCKNMILFLQYQDGNKLTLGGQNGFAMDYDIARDSFIDIMPPELEEYNYHEIKGAYTNSKGERFLFANCGFYKLLDSTGTFKSVFDPLPQIKTGIIESVYQDPLERYWLASVNELVVFSKTGTPLHRFEINKEISGIKSQIMPLKDGKIVVSLNSSELWFFDCRKENLGEPERHKLPFSSIFTMLTDKKGRTWFATDGDGLWYTDNLQSQDCHYVKLAPIGAETYEINKIYALTEDSEGGIWFGTQNAGLWHTNPYKKNTISFSEDLGFPKAVCTAFTEDHKGNIFVSSDGNGIYKIAKDGNITHLPKSSSNMTHLCLTQKGELLGCTWGTGIIQVDPESGNISPLSMKGLSNSSANMFGITATSDGEVWACPGNDDIYYRNTDGLWQKIELGYDSLSHWPNKWHLRVVEGRNGVKWILTTNSLWRYDHGKKKAQISDLAYVKSHNPLRINDGDCDKDGNFYLATNFGILRYPVQGGKADTLSYVQQRNIHTIRFDHNGILWAACDNGIWSIDVNKKICNVLPGNYDDLAKSNFFDRAGFVSENGDVFFGTNGGFYRFDSNALSEVDSLGYFGFSSLYIGNQKIKPGCDELSKGDINNIKVLELAYGRTNISIDIDFVDFSSLGDADISYRLKGLNDEWTKLTSDRRISFSYIPHGNYELEVKVEKTGYESVIKQISIGIEAQSPWWATWWFLLLALAALTGIAVLIYKKRVKNLQEQKAELKAKVDEQTLALRKILIEKDRLISVIAHDLKSPMFGIVGALENWQNKYKESNADMGQNIIEKTYGSAVMLQSTLLGLVDWAHEQENKLEYQPKEIDMAQLSANICKLQQTRANNKELRLVSDLQYSHCCLADERMLSTVMRNLVSNAIKFSNRGGDVVLKGWEENGKTIFQVIDKGVGMTEEQLAQFNNQHYCESTTGTENESGTGLGLSLCNEYVEKNKGQLTIASKKGEGTTITLSLPMGTKEVENRQDDENTQHATLCNEILQGNTILVVDDDNLICQNIATLLAPHMQVITANNGQEATELLKGNNIDIVLSDMEMPVMDGVELCKQVKANYQYVPFIFVSARTEENDRLAGLLSGAIDYISKPFSSQELLLKICNILQTRQKQQLALLQNKINTASDEDSKQPQANEQKQINPFVERFLALLESCYSNNMLSVEMLAQDMAVSQSTLGRKLKSLVGKTAIDILTEFRLNKAKELLKENKNTMQIGDIAFKVGFSDPSYFSKKFKDYFGYSPSEEA